MSQSPTDRPRTDQHRKDRPRTDQQPTKTRRLGPVVVAPDKFKGSLTAPEVAAHVAAAIGRARADVGVRIAPVADGGEGTVDAMAASGYTRVPVVVSGPTGDSVDACFARYGATAVVELAEASGLRRLPHGRPDPMGATSRGTGELVRAALDAGCDVIVLAVGGSACTDGGAGMLQALGARVRDSAGREVGPGGGALREVASIDLAGLDPRVRTARVVLASDVDNPLLGHEGAAAVYSPQKGADVGQAEELELGLQRWARVVSGATGRDAATLPGAGAAGGVGFAALAVLGAKMRPGVDLVLELIGFERLLEGARLVITGEGSLDRQSLRGKAPIGVARAAARHGVPVVAVVGRLSLDEAEVAAARLSAAYPLGLVEPDPACWSSQGGRLIEEVVASIVIPGWLDR